MSGIIWRLALAAAFIHTSKSIYTTDNDDDAKFWDKFTEGSTLTLQMMYDLVELWAQCAESTMPGRKFLVDSLQKLIVNPARTTVGLPPKYSHNRKFFGNLIGSTLFKEMLEIDENELRLSLIRKLQSCDDAVMDEKIMVDFYDREVDLGKA